MARVMRNNESGCCGPFRKNAWCNRRFGMSLQSKRQVMLWCVYMAIGVSVALTITLILNACDVILKARAKATAGYLHDGDLGMAWFTWTGSSLGLCYVACGCVLMTPAAASSGIPALLAFLNGVKPRGGRSLITGKLTQFSSLSTMIFKAIGMIMSIPSGMCIGPEGPIIHITALLAYWVAKLIHHLEGVFFASNGIKFVERATESRDFMATGAACGITTAFRAPLAGVLFVVEEAASFITVQHIEFTFLACLCSYISVWWMAQSALMGGGRPPPAPQAPAAAPVVLAPYPAARRRLPAFEAPAAPPVPTGGEEAGIPPKAALLPAEERRLARPFFRSGEPCCSLRVRRHVTSQAWETRRRRGAQRRGRKGAKAGQRRGAKALSTGAAGAGVGVG